MNPESRHASEPTIQADGKDKWKETDDEEKGQWGEGGGGRDEDGRLDVLALSRVCS